MNYKETIYLGYLDDPERKLELKHFPSFAGGIPLWLNYDKKENNP